MGSQKYGSKYSPAIINNPNMKQNATFDEWQRIAKRQSYHDNKTKVVINGNSLVSYELDDKLSSNEDQDKLETFFKEILLSKLSDRAKLPEIVGYLMTVFHQGGLFFPVTSALQDCLKEGTSAAADKPFAMFDANTLFRTINIVSTPTGFKIQETLKVNTLMVDPSSAFAKENFEVTQNTPMFPLQPDKGEKDYVIKAQGTLNLDFSDDIPPLNIPVESNTIDYGNKAIKKALDKRSWTQVIMDFVRNLTGQNKVQDLAPEEEKKQRSFKR